MTASPTPPTLEGMIAQFRRGARLVDAALAALEGLRQALADGVVDAAALGAILDLAAVDGDNLLVARPGRHRHTTVFALARSNGGPVRVQTIELDATALLGADDEPCPRRLGERARAVASALSIAKARLGLQASFLDAVLGADAPPRAADDPASTIRELALAAGRQLGSRRLSLAAGNRRTLETLFARALSAVN